MRYPPSLTLITLFALGCTDDSRSAAPRDTGRDTQAEDVASLDAAIDGDRPDMDADVASTSDTDPAPAETTIELTRGSGRSIEVELRTGGEPPIALRTEPPFGTLSDVVDAGDGFYRATLTPPDGATGAFTIEALSGSEVIARRRALSFAAIHERWGIPEPVPGLVNTPGWGGFG